MIEFYNFNPAYSGIILNFYSFKTTTYNNSIKIDDNRTAIASSAAAGAIVDREPLSVYASQAYPIGRPCKIIDESKETGTYFF